MRYTRRGIALGLSAIAVSVGVCGAIASADAVRVAPPQSPAGPVADAPQPGDQPDLPEAGDTPDLPGR